MSDRFRHLPDPVGDALSDATDEVRIERVYRQLRHAPVRRNERARTLRLCAGAALALATGLSVFLAGRWTAPSDARMPTRADARAHTGGAVIARDRRAVGRFAVGRTDLDDGSWISVGHAGLVETERNSARDLRLVLVRGVAEIEVRPGGARTWTIDCGLATVTVVGTRFSLARSNDDLRVRVARGVVSVRGDSVPDGVRFVRAGEELVVRAQHVGVEERAAAQVTMDVPADPTSRRARVAGEPARQDDWRQLADRGDWRGAYDAIGSDGIEQRVDDAAPEELLALADVARRSGHASEAVAPLDRLLSRHRGPEAALGAFTLGRLHADTLQQPEPAAAAFERALDDALPASLVPDALARLAGAQSASGRPERAAETARRYLAEYPTGPQRAAMEALRASTPR